jgi:hypothetical protein
LGTPSAALEVVVALVLHQRLSSDPAVFPDEAVFDLTGFQQLDQVGA